MLSQSVVQADHELIAGLGLTRDQLPQHIAVIMDGNGRWARRRRLPRVAGHRRGVQSVRRIVEECARLGIDYLTLYCLSIENWKRPKRELDQLMALLRRFLIQERPTIMNNNVRLTVIGRREGLPERVCNEMDRTIAMSAANTGLVLCLAINYGGRAELTDAIRSLARRVHEGEITPEMIDEPVVSDALYTRAMPDPDLLIRTAGEKRVSNFLLWQISYAEIWVSDVCWPDFSVSELHRSLKEYAARERRYGGLGGLAT